MKHTSAELSHYEVIGKQIWTSRHVQYMMRRMAFGVSVEEMQRLCKSTPDKIVDTYIRNAQKAPLIPEPTWAYWGKNRYQRLTGGINNKLIRKHVLEWGRTVLEDALTNGVRGKMVFFWMNHLVTGVRQYRSPSMLFQYYRIIEEHALGNFKTLIKEIGLTPAMLKYLNGNRNTKKSPNENYARELLELFTLGRDNHYTQEDIQEIARAFSGYKIENWKEVSFHENRHDDGQKIIFGKTGNWDYNDVIDILFEERKKEIAQFVCSKIYTSFVYHQPDDQAIEALSKVFLQHDFDIAPVMKKLFKSKHFLSEEFIGTKIKSPIELVLTFITELDIDISKSRQWKRIAAVSQWLGQNIFNPPDVSGYKGQRLWMDSTTLTRRWEVLDGILYRGIGKRNMRILVDFIQELTDNKDSPEEISRAIVNYFIPRDLQSSSAYDKVTQEFKAEWGEEAFAHGWWNIERKHTEWQVAQLISYVFRLPEFHLC